MSICKLLPNLKGLFVTLNKIHLYVMPPRYLDANKDGVGFQLCAGTGFSCAKYVMCGSGGSYIERQIGSKRNHYQSSGTVIITGGNDEQVDPVILIVDGVEKFITECTFSCPSGVVGVYLKTNPE